MSSGFRLLFVMYVWIRAISSAVIGKGGLGLHPLVILAVMVVWSGWTFLTWSPLSPCISIGRSPVCALMSSFMDSVPCAAAISICILSCVGGCMVVGSGV